MTFENTLPLDRFTNIGGGLILISGLIFGAAMFVIQSL